MAKELTYAERMVAATLASRLRNDLAAMDAGEGAGTVFAAASNALHPSDFKKFVKAARTQLKALDALAAGMPDRVADWVPFINAEQARDAEEDRLFVARMARKRTQRNNP